MDIRVNQMTPAAQTAQTETVQQGDGQFKFVLTSRISDEGLAERLNLMMQDIVQQGERISKKKDIRDMQKYRVLIKEFMNEIITRSHTFTRENFLDRRGRHRVYGIIRRVDETLDELAQELVNEQRDNISILDKIGQIEGLLLDIFT